MLASVPLGISMGENVLMVRVYRAGERRGTSEELELLSHVQRTLSMSNCDVRTGLSSPWFQTVHGNDSMI